MAKRKLPKALQENMQRMKAGKPLAKKKSGAKKKKGS